MSGFVGCARRPPAYFRLPNELEHIHYCIVSE